MSQPFAVRVLIGLAACSELLCARVYAEAHSAIPGNTPEEIEAPASVVPADNSAAPKKVATKKLSPAPVKVAAREVGAAAKKAAVSKASSKAAKRRNRQPTPEYRRMRDSWHAPIPKEPVAEPAARRPLVISPVNGNGGERVSIVPQRDDGGFTEGDQRLAARAFTPKGRLKVHPVAPHLLDLVYRAMIHFDATLVHLVSGYRPDRAGSRHTQGRAIDLVIPGVTNEALAEYLQSFGFVGVGIYPKSGFVHLDVRESSYYWIDNSLPDERCRTEPVMIEEAKRADRAARERGESPDAFVPNNDREDKAAAKAYKRRAVKRRAAADRAALSVSK